MDHVRLHTGREVIIREIRPEDQAGLRAAYDRLSPQSQYRRFLAPKPHLSEAETRYLVQIDGSDHYALVATPAERPDYILGVARFVRLPEDPGAAEMAVVVGDEFQGEGLASAVLERLAEAARARGVARFRATMLAENVPAHRMVRRLARGVARERHIGYTLEIELDLAPRAAMIGSCHGSSRSVQGRA
jgi:RimJ/RimL family protein N-acetyltransferase